jgi:hypothetical protein
MVSLDVDFKTIESPNLDGQLISKNVLYRREKAKSMQEIRLKRNQICEIFMSVLRSLLKSTFCKYHPNVNPKTIMLTKIVNLELEKICLEKYYNTVNA